MDMQSMMAQGQPQQADPTAQFKPASMPSVGDMLAAYRQRNEAIIAQSQQQAPSLPSQSPWQSDQINPEQLEQEKTNHSAWLTTQEVAAQQPAGFDDELHQNIMRNVASDKAIQEISEPFQGVLDHLRGFIQNGTMTKQEALAHLQDASPMITEAINKYHGPHSPSHKQSIFVNPDLHVEGEVLKKAKAAKGGKK